MGDREKDIYTGVDVDNITGKIRARYEKELEELRTLNAKLVASNEELGAYKKSNEDYKAKLLDSEFRAEFVKRGGNEAAWEDFKVANGAIMDLSGEELDKAFEDLKANKSYYFNGAVGSVANIDEMGELEDLFGGADNSLVEGTIYRSQKF